MKLAIGMTRAQVRSLFKARRVMRGDFTNRNNTLSLRIAAKGAFLECSERISVELQAGARTTRNQE